MKTKFNNVLVKLPPNDNKLYTCIVRNKEGLEDIASYMNGEFREPMCSKFKASEISEWVILDGILDKNNPEYGAIKAANEIYEMIELEERILALFDKIKNPTFGLPENILNEIEDITKLMKGE